jgi:hypothetical protein
VVVRRKKKKKQQKTRASIRIIYTDAGADGRLNRTEIANAEFARVKVTDIHMGNQTEKSVEKKNN